MLQIKTTRITILISNYEGQKTKSMITFFLRRTKSQSCCNSMYIELIDKEHQSPQNNPHQKKKKKPTKTSPHFKHPSHFQSSTTSFVLAWK